MEKSTVFAAIRYRRSVREYDPRPIEDWKLDILLEAARLAPSSTNSQPWRIVVVKDPDIRKQLSLATPGGINHHKWMEDAPVVMALCAIKSNAQKFAQLIGKNYHLVDIGIAGEHVVLTATELGLGTCWVGWIDKKRVRSILGIPANAEIVCLLIIGYPKNEAFSAGEMVDQFAAVEPRQEQGEIGIGGIAANKRKSLDEIVFHDKVNA
ncbi:MAG TPA: nitroreductase family protein [Candidatus Lokiarchaeia archaeon]|nr:nitroreductase family protein [Candidatus Lokiarchaeia archaeon]